ncbi:MAG TPA: FAD-dependent oxidoreductase [Bacteroidota bacterium]|nr:FAD-dependent oxidoreductase [Bacteroidota bacterium]
MKRRILVIGGLAAGPTAASKAKRVDPDADVILYEQGEHISYGICEIPYLLSGEVSENEKLILFSPAALHDKKGVTAHTSHVVEEIIPYASEIRVRDLHSRLSRAEKYDRLIIATGSTPRKLGIDGEGSRNVFIIKDLGEAFALKKYLDEEKPRRALIIGGGFIGIEMADALVRRGIETTILHNGSMPMSKFEEDARKILLSEIETHGVSFVPRSKVEWLGRGSRGNVVAAGTKDRTIETDLVIVAVGVEPNSGLAKSAGIHTGVSGGISVDDKMRALGAEHVYAAGDCCEVRNTVTRKPMYVSLATLASKTARIAGENAAGGGAVFKGALRAIGLRVFSKEAAQVGLSSAEAEEASFDVVLESVTTDSRVAMMPGAGKVAITLIADRRSRKLLGANVIGESGAILRANALAVAIRHGLTIDDVEQFDLIYTPPYAPLWDGIIIGARKMKKRI